MRLPGTVVACREKWADLRGMGFGFDVAYYLDSAKPNGDEDLDAKRCRTDYCVRWRSAATMPAWAVRPELRECKVASVNVHQLRALLDGGMSIFEQIVWGHREWDARNKPGRRWLDNPYVGVERVEM